MNLIDRYVYAVTERLPANTREDVAKELRSNIEDMLPKNATAEDVRAVLVKLGNPIKLAAEYNHEKKYLIGPGLYEKYISTLKLVMGVTSAAVILIYLLGIIFKPSADIGAFNLSAVTFVQIFAAIFQMLTQVFLWVTLVFIVLEKTGISAGRLPFTKKEWSPDALPSISIPEKKRISRYEAIFSLSFTIVFILLIYSQPQFIGWYEKGSHGFTLVEPFFNAERLQTYIYIVIILAIIQLFISIYKLTVIYWNIQLAVVVAVYNAVLCMLAVTMINDSTILNQGFLLHFSSAVASTVPEASRMWQIGGWIFAVIFLGISIWDSIANFHKCKV